MIYESHVWKEELKKERDIFIQEVVNAAPILDDENSDWINLKIEKFFFVSSFIMRKLNEAHKLSDELNTKKIPLEKCLRINKSKAIDPPWQAEAIEEFYDLENWQETSLGITTLSNYLVHSFIFRRVVEDVIDPGNRNLTGVFFNSDHTKDSCLYYLTIEKFFEIIDEVIKDDVVTLHWRRGSKKNSYSRD